MRESVCVRVAVARSNENCEGRPTERDPSAAVRAVCEGSAQRRARSHTHTYTHLATHSPRTKDFRSQGEKREKKVEERDTFFEEHFEIRMSRKRAKQ